MTLDTYISSKIIVTMYESLLQIYQSHKDLNIKLQSKLVTELQTFFIEKSQSKYKNKKSKTYHKQPSSQEKFLPGGLLHSRAGVWVVLLVMGKSSKLFV